MLELLIVLVDVERLCHLFVFMHLRSEAARGVEKGNIMKIRKI